MTRDVVIIGAGLTGATAAHMLARAGFHPLVVEASHSVGGHVRTGWFGRTPYEPNGAHIFRTNDDGVWRLASAMAEFVPYEHRVKTDVGGQLLSWPIQVDEIDRLPEAARIHAELDLLPDEPDTTNFETWCISLMGPTLYELFIRDYTAKQWGRPAHELDTSFAPKRVELRDDGYLGLFRDRHQGWPREGYTALVEQLLATAQVPVQLGSPVDASTLSEVAPPSVPVVLTCPLDSFFLDAHGPLEWRGVRFVTKVMPEVALAQPAMVVNCPGGDVAYTRTIETKHALPWLSDKPGTAVSYEYPGASAKHYPVPDVAGQNARRQALYVASAAAFDRNPLVLAGRLAKYLYINMDEAMRQGIAAATAAEAIARSR